MGIAHAITERNTARPFRPYEIKMISGAYYSVRHPEFAAVSSRGDAVDYYEPGEKPRTLNALLIEWVR